MLVMVATAPYVGFVSPNPQASVSWALQAFGQCRVNAYDCRDFSTQVEAQAVYWACGGRNNDVHRLDRIETAEVPGRADGRRAIQRDAGATAC